MLHTNNPIIKHKAGLLNLAQELGNVSAHCENWEHNANAVSDTTTKNFPARHGAPWSKDEYQQPILVKGRASRQVNWPNVISVRPAAYRVRVSVCSSPDFAGTTMLIQCVS